MSNENDKLANRTLAFSPERMRAALWQNLQIPTELFQTAIDELQSQLKAKKVEYFAWHGEVISKKVVKDNAARLSAIDKVLSITGSYIRERDTGAKEPTTVTIEVGRDGVHRIIIGAPQAALPPESEVTDADNLTNYQTKKQPGLAHAEPLELRSDNEVPEVFRITKDTPRENVIQMFKDPEPEGDGNGRIP